MTLTPMAARWSELVIEAAALAGVAKELFAQHEVVVLGTVSRSGRARLSLVEPRVIDGRLVIGTDSRDAKTADLRHDARCTLHTLVVHRTHGEPVFKARLLAHEITDGQLAEAVACLTRPEIGWRPSAAFELRFESATVFNAGRPVTWRCSRVT